MTSLIVVDGYRPAAHAEPSVLDNLRDGVWAFALDQRAFGPRKLLVAFADADGTFRGLAYTDRAEPLLASFDACLAYLGPGAAAAVAFNDECVTDEPPSGLLERFEQARAVAGERGIHLVDWISCDDDRFRSTRMTIAAEGDDWWDVPIGVT